MIDKGYLLGYAIYNGKVVTGSPLFDGNIETDITIDEAFALDMPTGKVAEITENPGLGVVTIDEDIVEEWARDKALVLNTLARQAGRYVKVSVSPYITPALQKSVHDVLEEVVRYFNIQNAKGHTSHKYMDAVIKNRTLNNMFRIMQDPENFANASTSVDTVSEEPKAIAAATEAASAKYTLNYDNPVCFAEMQAQNMVGKEVIGIAAVALKGFFAATSYYNNRISDIEKMVKAGAPAEEILKAVNKLIKQNPFYDVAFQTSDGTTISGPADTVLANLNFQDLLDILEEKDVILPEEQIRCFYNPLTKKSEPIQTTSLRELVKKMSKIAMINDTVFSDSAVLTLATDGGCKLL